MARAQKNVHKTLNAVDLFLRLRHLGLAPGSSGKTFKH